MPHDAPFELIDLSRYPIRDLGAPAARALVERCRRELETTGACELPGFLRAEATARMAAESETLVPLGHHQVGPITAYLEIPDPGWPDGHPRRHWGRSAVSAIAYDLIPERHALRRLYEWDGLMEFLAAALGKPRLYRYADPFGALNVAAMGEGDELFWHFDQTDFVVSIALRDAETGGDFEYAPLIRSREEERYEAVKQLLDGSRERVVHVPMTPGTLLLFEGRHSIHRVTRVGGAVSRLVSLLAYDTQPGTVSSELLRLARYGRKAPQPASGAP
jgi:hypothetical protein